MRNRQFRSIAVFLGKNGFCRQIFKIFLTRWERISEFDSSVVLPLAPGAGDALFHLRCSGDTSGNRCGMATVSCTVGSQLIMARPWAANVES